MRVVLDFLLLEMPLEYVVFNNIRPSSPISLQKLPFGKLRQLWKTTMLKEKNDTWVMFNSIPIG